MFARYAGINYKDYLQNIRLEHAVKDLENTDKQIVDIAFDHGFANSKAFTNLFRKRYGMLTSEYRKQLVKKKQRESYAHHRALLEKTKSDIVKTKKGMSPWLPNCYTQKNEYEEVIMEIFLLMMKIP